MRPFRFYSLSFTSLNKIGAMYVILHTQDMKGTYSILPPSSLSLRLLIIKKSIPSPWRARSSAMVVLPNPQSYQPISFGLLLLPVFGH